MDSVAVATPPPQPAPTPRLMFLRRPCASPEYGRGYCTFESTDTPKAYAKLRITFQGGKTLEGGLIFFGGLGVRFSVGPLLDLEIEPAGLNGHHGARGFGVCERAAAAVLAEQGRWAA